MTLSIGFFLSLAAALSSQLSECHLDVGEDGGKYLNEWVVRVRGGPQDAHQLAEDHGFEMVRKLVVLEDAYLVRKSSMSKRNLVESTSHTEQLAKDPRVLMVVQNKYLNMRTARVPSPITFDDPLWKKQWYLETHSNCDGLVVDLNVENAWQNGFTGTGVKVLVIDTGIDITHPDLSPNYDSTASYDAIDEDDNIVPANKDMHNAHGTECAGVIAMVANNSYCGVGVAYGSKVSGIRFLDSEEETTEAMQVEAMGYKCDYWDIARNSWGPVNGGLELFDVSDLVQEVFTKCMSEGRGGKGVLYVFAAGNGRRDYNENCASNGLVNSIYTITVSSNSYQANTVWYSEQCSGVLVAAPSGLAYQGATVSGPVFNSDCISSFIGTSSSVPQVSGALALVLQANPSLTWRDCQHILVCTSENYLFKQIPLDGWYQNAAGFYYNHAFGFGTVNAYRAVQAASHWVNVGAQRSCVVTYAPSEPQAFYKISLSGSDYYGVQQPLTVACGGSDIINHLEHVLLTVSLTSIYRGNIQIMLQSPSGTVSTLLFPRNKDNNKDFDNWTMKSVHFWGENPNGQWTCIIYYNVPVERLPKDSNVGRVSSLTLTLFGTNEKPSYQDDLTLCGTPLEQQDSAACG